jgi:beta-xylosidase
LAGYRRVTVEAGESVRVAFDLHAERTSFTGIDGRRLVESGSFTLAAGPSSENLPLTASFAITADRILTGPRVLTTPSSVR